VSTAVNICDCNGLNHGRCEVFERSDARGKQAVPACYMKCVTRMFPVPTQFQFPFRLIVGSNFVTEQRCVLCRQRARFISWGFLKPSEAEAGLYNI
jgi:hypothetical protein